jgi:hypothetical protein
MGKKKRVPRNYGPLENIVSKIPFWFGNYMKNYNYGSVW